MWDKLIDQWILVNSAAVAVFRLGLNSVWPRSVIVSFAIKCSGKQIGVKQTK
jgi:hypothetical protein